MSTERISILSIFLLLLIAIVHADSEYCIPAAGTDVVIISEGTWTNLTITSDECPICVGTVVGLECTECPETEQTPCIPSQNVWCPIPTPTIAAPQCFLIWCPVPTIMPTPTPTPVLPCPIGEWCPA